MTDTQQVKTLIVLASLLSNPEHYLKHECQVPICDFPMEKKTCAATVTSPRVFLVVLTHLILI